MSQAILGVLRSAREIEMESDRLWALGREDRLVCGGPEWEEEEDEDIYDDDDDDDDGDDFFEGDDDDFDDDDDDDDDDFDVAELND